MLYASVLLLMINCAITLPKSTAEPRACATATLCLSVHVSKICSKAFYGLNKIQQIRKFLSPETAKTLVHAFVSSLLDHCDSLLYSALNCPSDRRQKILNGAAILIFGLSKFGHISTALYDLHCDLSCSI